MGISFGSTGIKPYVGSKEVQEAYVGSQLVYQNAPPYVYAFLGTSNDYVLADWCTLTKNATVQKYNGVYKISIAADRPSGTVTLDITSLKHKNKISFDYMSTSYDNNIYIGSESYKLPYNNKFGRREFTIPNGVTQIRFTAYSSDSHISNALRLDAIKIE